MILLSCKIMSNIAKYSEFQFLLKICIHIPGYFVLLCSIKYYSTISLGKSTAPSIILHAQILHLGHSSPSNIVFYKNDPVSNYIIIKNCLANIVWGAIQEFWFCVSVVWFRPIYCIKNKWASNISMKQDPPHLLQMLYFNMQSVEFSKNRFNSDIRWISDGQFTNFP